MPRADIDRQNEVGGFWGSLPLRQLSARSSDDPPANGQDEAVGFRQRNELVRWHGQTAADTLGWRPAQQCFCPDHLASHINERLVIEVKFVAVERPSQAVFHGQSGINLTLSRFVKHAHGMAAGVFRAVKRHIGLSQQRVCRLCAIEQRDAHAGAHAEGQVRTFEEVGGTQDVKQLVAKSNGIFGCLACMGIQVRQYHNVLVATQAGHGIALAHAGCQSVADLFQQHITDIVTPRVIEVFEPVEIEHHQCAMSVGA